MNQTRRRWFARFFSAAPAIETDAGTAEGETSEFANNRGALYASGEGVPLDFARAAEFFKRAADAGYAPAQNNLGMLFASGQGVLRSESEACRWFRRSAEQGDASGQFNLGNHCHPARLGRLVSEEGEARIQSYMWFSLAAAQGYYKATAFCETLNIQMSQHELDESNRRIAAFLPKLEVAQ